jgi:glutamate formiminotransferase / formiminotetrahydrofolate cyclodeaminase
MRLVECVPNFSEGRDSKVLDAIADAIRAVDGVELLDVDPGKATNRTVFTFVGDPDAAVEAAFQAIAQACALIDMSKHEGAHPRMGATDVCPFIPVSGVTMAECATLAGRLGKRVGEELKIPVYLYGEAATCNERRNLADIRSGEYEGLSEKMKTPDFKPDFGPGEFNARTGATVIGARKFLIAYNINLNSRSRKLATEIAYNIREQGRFKRDDKGKFVRDEKGKALRVPGSLKACKGVGWYIEEYGCAQVSLNLVDYHTTSMHTAFDEASRQAEKLGVRITGSEVVGLVPLEPMLLAGRHYLAKQGRCQGVPVEELIDIAARSLGLSDVSPFVPQEKIIEYRVANGNSKLKDMTVAGFTAELSSESPAPGGGSVAALCGGLSAALSSMVANLTHGKKGFEPVRGVMDEIAVSAQDLKDSFVRLIDADTDAFRGILDALRLPKDSEENKTIRMRAILDANKHATNVPLTVLDNCLKAVDLAQIVVEQGMPNSLSDAGVAALTAEAGARAAHYNVLINLAGIKNDDPEYTRHSLESANRLVSSVSDKTESLNKKVLSLLSAPLSE